MAENPKFKYRFMRPGEAKRLAHLIGELQRHQQMEGVPRLPSQSDIEQELFHRDDEGCEVPHNLGTFSALAIDTAKPEGVDKSNIVGYLVYTLSFTLDHGRKFYINSFFIEAPYRRHGIGRKLIEFMQHHAKLLKINRFDVPFMLNNAIGQAFYKKLGAQLVGDEYNLVLAPLDQVRPDNC